MENDYGWFWWNGINSSLGCLMQKHVVASFNIVMSTVLAPM